VAGDHSGARRVRVRLGAFDVSNQPRNELGAHGRASWWLGLDRAAFRPALNTREKRRRRLSFRQAAEQQRFIQVHGVRRVLAPSASAATATLFWRDGRG